MAQLHRKQQLQGLIGPLVLRSLNGKTIVQTRSVNMKQTQGTLASSSTFKYAVAQSKAIRSSLTPLLEVGADPHASQRLTGGLQKAFHFPQGYQEHLTLFSAALDGLIGFEFNTRSRLQDCLPMALPFEVTNIGSVKLEPTEIPALQHNAVAVDYLGAQLAVMIVGFLPDNRGTFSTDAFGFELQHNLPTSIALESQPFPTGTRIIIAAQLLLWNHRTVLGDRNYVNSKLFNPVQVVWTEVV